MTVTLTEPKQKKEVWLWIKKASKSVGLPEWLIQEWAKAGIVKYTGHPGYRGELQIELGSLQEAIWRTLELDPYYETLEEYRSRGDYSACSKHKGVPSATNL